MAIMFPEIDPVAVHIGPLVIRWYALAYVAGILCGWAWANRNADKFAQYWGGRPNKDDIDTLVTYVIAGVILGGRLGYVVFYNPGHYLSAPMDVFKLWQGGMSFHGGCIGVMTAFGIFCHREKLSYLRVGDIVSFSVPFGLFFGRIANFINGELFGRVTTVPWAILFPGDGGYLPRHPSQLYEAMLEGPILFAVLYAISRSRIFIDRPGVLGFTFLAGYGIARFCVEFVRQPDPQLGELAGLITMGQLLSLIMVAIGGAGIAWAMKRNVAISQPA
jgi:phosphatidylglycerol:prolipoprotein diacylglycerol transferase